MVRLGAEDLRQAHGLPVRVGDLEAHAGLARNGLDHADRHHRERPREVPHEVDYLAAFHAHRRLDLVARDDRAGIGGEHFHRHAEIGELLLDQPGSEFEGLGAHLLGIGLRFVQELERRQRRVGQVVEQRRLLFLLHPLRLLDLGDRRLDVERLVVFLALFLRFDDELTLLARDFPEPAILAALAHALRRGQKALRGPGR